jgi:hypothetical protein
MGTSFSTEVDPMERKWNQAEDSVERYKTDMLTLVNVIKFCAKAEKDSHNKANYMLDYEWASAIAKATAVSNDQSKSKIWTQVANAATEVATGCVNNNRMVSKSMEMPLTVAAESAENMMRTVAEAWNMTQKWITDVLVQVEVAKDWDDATRKATREKTERALSAGAEARIMSQYALRVYPIPPILEHSYWRAWKVWNAQRKAFEDRWNTNIISIQFSTCLSPNDFTIDSSATVLDRAIVVKIEDTTTPFMEIADITPFSELCKVVHEAKRMVSDLVNYLHTLHGTRMQTKLEIQ